MHLLLYPVTLNNASNCGLAVWFSGITLVSINIVALHWARLILEWVTCLLTDCLSPYVPNHQGPLSLPSRRGRIIDYQPDYGLSGWGAFTCVGYQVTLCDPICQVTPCS